jgi:hypothetical protein
MGARNAGLLRFLWLVLSASCVVATASTSVEACPNCEAGRQARSEVWSDDFGFNLSVTLLPFLVIGAICLHAESMGRKAKEPS